MHIHEHHIELLWSIFNIWHFKIMWWCSVAIAASRCTAADISTSYICGVCLFLRQINSLKRLDMRWMSCLWDCCFFSYKQTGLKYEKMKRLEMILTDVNIPAAEDALMNWMEWWCCWWFSNSIYLNCIANSYFLINYLEIYIRRCLPSSSQSQISKLWNDADDRLKNSKYNQCSSHVLHREIVPLNRQ